MIYLLYITAALNILLGLFTFVNKPKSKVNIYFFFLSAGIAIWAVTNALFQESLNEEDMYFWALIAYVVASFMLFSVKIFSYEVSKKNFSTLNALTTISCLLFGMVTPLIDDLVATGVKFNERSIIGGPLLPVLFIVYLYLMIDSMYVLNQAKNVASGNQKPQLRLIFFGIMGAIVSGTFTNLILPSLGIYRAVALGPSFTLIMLGFISYAILRHRLFDIRVLIGRIVYYTLLSIIPYTAFFVLAFLYPQTFGSIFTPAVYLISVPISFLFVIIFNYTNEFLRTQVTSRLINPGYNPLETAERLSNDLSVMIELPAISDTILTTIKKTIRPDYAGLIIYSDEKHPNERVFLSDPNRQVVNLDKIKQTGTTLWTTVGKHPIVLDEIEIEISDGIYRNVPNIANEMEKLMREIGAKVILTLGEDEKVIGLYIIGLKESDSPYTNGDIDFLKSIANTGALAIERSLLYSEVQEFAQTLQKKVDDATHELKKTNSDLQSALLQLQEARRQERDMIDVMGHELRTPITIVRNGLLMLRKQLDQLQADEKSTTEDEKGLDKYLDMSIESTRREITLIETLLSATKIDGSRMQLYLTKVDFRDVVDDAMEGQKDPISKKNLEILYTKPKEDIFVYADRTRIQEIMDNLLSNAVKYTMHGQVKVEIWKDEKFGWGRVVDTGIGISEDDLQNLGKKFFRAKQYVSDHAENGENIVRPGGTGLGLYVVFDLIGIMGGVLYVNSKVGEGTTFTFSMPLHTGQEDHQVDQTFDSKPESRKNHIFLNKESPQPGK